MVSCENTSIVYDRLTSSNGSADMGRKGVPLLSSLWMCIWHGCMRIREEYLAGVVLYVSRSDVLGLW